jgi:hypothetical protein
VQIKKRVLGHWGVINTLSFQLVPAQYALAADLATLTAVDTVWLDENSGGGDSNYRDESPYPYPCCNNQKLNAY